MDVFPIILVVHLLLAIGLVGVVLLQRSEGGALGIGGGGGGVMSGRAAGNLLTQTTTILGGLFFCTSLLLAVLANGHNKTTESPFDKLPTQAPISAPAMPNAGGPNATGSNTTTPNAAAPVAPESGAPAAPLGR